MHGDKYSIMLSKNGGDAKPLESWNGLKNATNCYSRYVKWYSESYQRIDTSFNIELLDLETLKAIESKHLPIKDVA